MTVRRNDAAPAAPPPMAEFDAPEPQAKARSTKKSKKTAKAHGEDADRRLNETIRKRNQETLRAYNGSKRNVLDYEDEFRTITLTTIDGGPIGRLSLIHDKISTQMKNETPGQKTALIPDENRTWRGTPRVNRAPGKDGKTVQIAARLPESLLVEFDAVVAHCKPPNRTLAIEKAVREFIEKYSQKP